MNVTAVAAEQARELADELRSLHGAELERRLRFLAKVDFAAAHKACPYFGAELQRFSMLETSQAWLDSDAASRIADGVRATGWMQLSGDVLRRQLQRLERNPVADAIEVWSAYCVVVGAPTNTWAVAPLIEHLRSRIATDTTGGGLFDAPQALMRIGDPNAIPQLIGLLAARDTTETRYAIGYYALSDLAGVVYDASHDAGWWRAWWSENSSRFPKCTTQAIPVFQLDR
jgi:hypothetical protein